MTKASTKPKSGVKSKPVIGRTMATLATNTNRNPMDLEVSSDEEAAPKPLRKKRKKLQKTPEEIDAEEQKRDNALATVSNLEEEMTRQNSINDGTPRPPSTARYIFPTGSYVAPDPQSARIKSASKTTAILTTTDEELEEAQPQAKNARPPRSESNDTNVKQVASKVRNKKLAQQKKVDVSMVSVIESYLKHILTFLAQNVDSDSDKVKPKAKKAKLLRVELDSIKLNRAADEERDTRMKLLDEPMVSITSRSSNISYVSCTGCRLGQPRRGSTPDKESQAIPEQTNGEGSLVIA